MADHHKDLYYIDFNKRLSDIQHEMKKQDIDIYLGSRLRTLSWIVDVFCPWRSFIVIPADGLPTIFTFAIDAARIGNDTWLDSSHVMGYAPVGNSDQMNQISDFMKTKLNNGKGRIAYETGMSNYLPEGYLTQYEYQRFTEDLPKCEFINAHIIIDQLSLIKDQGTINRFKEASRIVDIGHQAIFDALHAPNFLDLTETEIAGLAAYEMRKAGSVSEWNFAGGNEIASGYRTGFWIGACTPPTQKKIEKGEPLMVDIHAMFKLALGDHAHNYLISPVTERQRWHANNFLEVVKMAIDMYKTGITPGKLADEITGFATQEGFVDFLLPGFEHGIGLMGDEWRIGLNDGPAQYWTNPDHVYQENELLICAIQYACPQENIGFRYENPIVIQKDGCDVLSKFPLTVNEID